MADPSIKYGHGVDFSDANTSHTRMLRLIGANKRVLEFGCSSGYMSAALRQQGCMVTGVEVDPTAAELAKPYCHHVIVADLDRDDWSREIAGETFDVAVFGDVLEHLKDPSATLKRVRDFLGPSGHVVASLPNIAHGSVRLALLEGRFEYRSLGLLDDTHLRFFTRQSLETLFRNAGYRIDVIERAKLDIFDTEIAVDPAQHDPALVEKLRRDEDALTYQFICRATPVRSTGSSLVNDEELHRQPAGNTSNNACDEVGMARLASATRQLEDAKRRISELETQLAAREATLKAVFESKGWRLLNYYRSAKMRARSVGKPLATLLGLRRRQVISTEMYRRWIAQVEALSLDMRSMAEAAQQLAYKPLVSIIMPVFNPKLDDLRKAVASVQAQIYGNWQLCICDDASTLPEIRPFLSELENSDERIHIAYHDTNRRISEASNSALHLSKGEFVGFLDHDDELVPHALFEVVALLQRRPEADVIYSDEDKLDFNGQRCDPFFKPDWSPEYMLSCMYTCHFGVYRRSLVESVGGLRRGFEGSQDYDLVLRMSEQTDRIVHIPKVLYHWRQTATSTAASARAKSYSTDSGRRALEEHLQRCNIEGTIDPGAGPNRYRVRPVIKGQPLVSIIIPTKDNVPVLKRCLDSIAEKTAYRHYEIIVVNNNSAESRTEEYLRGLPHRVIELKEPFNFSRINNVAAQQANGEHLLLLNNDTEVISHDWLSAMLECVQLKGVGAVGAKLYYPNGTIQHAGVVLGIGGVAGHSHKYFPTRNRGYFDSLVCIRNYSAVTAACALIPHKVFDEVSGLDEDLAVAFNDVDLCLRIRDAGYRIVWTPYAELYHHESVSRGFNMNAAEIALMLERWGDRLKHDPYYNPNLTLVHENFTLDI